MVEVKLRVVVVGGVWERVGVVGNHAVMGSWKPGDSLRLFKVDEKAYEGSFEMEEHELKRLEYKFVLLSKERPMKVLWESGRNRKVDACNVGGCVVTEEVSLVGGQFDGAKTCEEGSTDFFTDEASFRQNSASDVLSFSGAEHTSNDPQTSSAHEIEHNESQKGAEFDTSPISVAEDFSESKVPSSIPEPSVSEVSDDSAQIDDDFSETADRACDLTSSAAKAGSVSSEEVKNTGDADKNAERASRAPVIRRLLTAGALAAGVIIAYGPFGQPGFNMQPV